MRYGIPLLGNRVAPRCNCADCILIITSVRGKITGQQRVPLDITSPLNLVSSLRARRIDTLVCGGINRETRESVAGGPVTVIDNVACSAEQALAAIAAGRLHSGFGFQAQDQGAILLDDSAVVGEGEERPGDGAGLPGLDCLGCRARVCLKGETCIPAERVGRPAISADAMRMLEAATDISSESERQLCRLAELVYFCFEMKIHRVGIAFCEDLREPAEVLNGVLRRSLDTIPVGCRIGGPIQSDDGPVQLPIRCNPLAQAAALNQAGTELNVIVGLCMGSDCVFSMESDAPVTTLFVKDRSLANNPIGAVYSEYYLRESVSSARPPGHLAENHSMKKERS